MQIIISFGSSISQTVIKIDDAKPLFLVNDKPKDIDINRFIMRMQSIISSWQYTMINNRIIDGSWYDIKIKSGDNKRHYVGKNAYPQNYDEFISLLNEVI